MSKQKKIYTGCLSKVDDIRLFAKEAFVYGLKHKDQYTEIGNHTYENRTRNISDWFQECVHTRTVELNKRAKYMSLDCRNYSCNPLYKMWKACSFTKNELVFFFFLLDYLEDRKETANLRELCDEYYKLFDYCEWTPFFTDAARRFLKEKVVPFGIVISENNEYRLSPNINLSDYLDMLLFYSEIAPGGVIGSFILDKQGDVSEFPFAFKQHYPGQALDCEIVSNVLYAIRNGKVIELQYLIENNDNNTIKNKSFTRKILPIKVYSSTKNGRQYMMCLDYSIKNYSCCRIDRIQNISFIDEDEPDIATIKSNFENMRKHIWGVSLGRNLFLTHVEFVVHVEMDEGYIVRRLIREKRCGKVTQNEDDPHRFKFEADVYDAREMFPWIRSFIGRIVNCCFSDPQLNCLFIQSLNEMYDLYSIRGDQL